MATIQRCAKAEDFKWLTDLIPYGKRNGIPLNLLEKLTGRDKVRLKYDILAARISGQLICSGNTGYFFAADEGELLEYIRKREKYLQTADDAMKHFRLAVVKPIE